MHEIKKSGIRVVLLLALSIYPSIHLFAQHNKSQQRATVKTKEINNKVYSLLDFSDKRETEFAKKGLLKEAVDLEIKDKNDSIVWSQKKYKFLEKKKKAPATVNPSLWRNTQHNHIAGLFEVTDGIYQVRGFDMSNISFVRGNTGWIVFDPLMSVECSKAALKFLEDYFWETKKEKPLPIMGIVISHPHIDHFGGIKGIISEEEVIKRGVKIIVPEHFEEHAVSENVYAGNAMARRALYQYGAAIESNELGSMSIGIGMGQSTGSISYIKPTNEIKKTGETITIDGVTMLFHMTPGTECHAEMNTWIKDKKTLWLAENCTGTLHNLYTIRGAEVRNGNAWAKYIMEANSLFGDEVEIVFQSHNWPHWGNKTINEYMINTAAMYKFINDQSLMYINQGYTSDEISNMISLPKNLEKNWYTRQYYGTLSTNSKAVYQKYMGWYDANPAHLNPITPTEKAKKYVEYLGDVDRVIKMAKNDFAKGEYRWVAEIMNVLVFANPKNQAARNLGADALEQLAYQSESGTWRNSYLTGAKELRFGVDRNNAVMIKGGAMDIISNMTVEMMLDYLGIVTDSKAAQDLNLKINLKFIDDAPYLLTISSGVVLWQKNRQINNANATLTLNRLGLLAILSKDEEMLKRIKVEGEQDVLKKLTENICDFDFFFNIIEPKPLANRNL